VAMKISKENAGDACNKLISQDITTADVFVGYPESDLSNVISRSTICYIEYP